MAPVHLQHQLRQDPYLRAEEGVRRRLPPESQGRTPERERADEDAGGAQEEGGGGAPPVGRRSLLRQRLRRTHGRRIPCRLPPALLK